MNIYKKTYLYLMNNIKNNKKNKCNIKKINVNIFNNKINIIILNIIKKVNNNENNLLL